MTKTKYFPSKEWLIQENKFKDPNSVWASCGYCETTFYLGQLEDQITVHELGKTTVNLTMYDKEKAEELANRWLSDHIYFYCRDRKRGKII